MSDKKDPILTPKASTGTWVLMGIIIFIVVVILGLVGQWQWTSVQQPLFFAPLSTEPMSAEMPMEVVSARTLPRSRFTNRSKYSRFA